MATDFGKNTTQSKGGFQPNATDTPLDVRTRVETEADIMSIPRPYVGMVVYVKDTGKRFEVTKLKAKKQGLSTTQNAAVDEYRELTVSYNDLTDKPEIPSIEGLATEEYVRQQIESIEIPEVPEVDLSGLATKDAVEEVKTALEEEIARAKAREDEIASEIDDEEPYMAGLSAYPTSKFLFGCGHPLYVEGQEDGSVVVSFKAMGENKEIVLSPEDAAKTYIVGGYGQDNHNSKRSLPATKVVAKNAKIKGIVGGHYFEGIVGHARIEAENCQMVAVMAGGWCGANVDGRQTRLNIVHKAEVELVNCTVSSTLYGGSQGNGVVDELNMVIDGVKAGWVTVGGSNGLTNEGCLEVKGDSEITVLQTVNRGLVRHAKVVLNDGSVKQFFLGGETEDSSVNGAINEVEVHLMGGTVDKLRLGTSEGQPFASVVKGSIFRTEVKESEFDLSQLEAVKEPEVIEYALKDHKHDEYLTAHQDISHLAVKEEMEAAHAELEARLEEEIARAKAREDEIAAEIDDEEPYMADLAAYPTSKFLFGCGHPLYVEGQEDGSVVVSYKWAGEMVGITLPAEDAAKTYIVGGYGHDNHNSKRSLPMTKVVAKNAKIKGIVGGHYFEGIVGHAYIEAENCQMVAVMAGGWCGANVDGRTTRLNIVHEAECKLTNCTVSSTFYGGSQGNGTVDKSHVVLDGVKAGWVTVGGSNGLTNEGHLEVKGESEITVLQTVNRGLVRKARVDIHEGQVKQLFVGGETEDSSVNGIVKEVEMNLMGGVVDKLRLGTSEGQPFAGKLEGSMRQPEVKESEVDLGLFKVIEDEVLPEYALKDHTHEGMATEAFVKEEIAKAQLSGGEGEVDLSAYATKAELEEVRAQIPSVEGLATEQFVQDAIAGIEFPEVPSVEGLATEEFVGECVDNANTILNNRIDLEVEALEEKIAGIEHPTFDDSHLATKEEIKAVKAALEEEVARAKAREDEIAAEIDDEEPYMADLAAYPTSKFLFACGHPVYAEGQEDGSVVVSFKAMGENKEIVLPAEDAAKTYIVGGYGHDNHNSKRSLPMTKVVVKNAKIKGIVGGHYFEGIVGHAHIEAENCQMVSVIAGGWCGANVDGRTTRLNIVHKAECKLTNCTVSSTFFGGSQGNGTVDESHVVLDGVKAGWVTVGGSNGLTNGGHLEVKGESDIKVLQTVNRGLVRKAVVDIHEGHVEQLFVGGETEDKTVDGVVKEVELNLMGGVIDKLRVGTSEGQQFAGQLEGSMRQPEVKESEVDLSSFKVIEDEIQPEYALKDHIHDEYALVDHEHEEYLKEHQDISHLATKEGLDALGERVDVLEKINLETKPYIDKNGMLVLCGCPAVARGEGEEVHVSVRFFNGEEDKFVFTKDEFAKTRICMGYGAEGVGTKRNIVETTLELYDIEKVFIIDGGSQVTGEVGTVNIIAERCGYIDGIQGARAMNGGERNIVHNFNVRVKDCGLIDTLYGGGNGYSVVWNNNIIVEGETEINYLITGGSNGYTNRGNVVINGAHIKTLHAVNRGIVNHSSITLKDGLVDLAYFGGDATMPDAGTVHHSELHLLGGKIVNLQAGLNAENIGGTIDACVVENGDTSVLEPVIHPEVPEYALKDHEHEEFASFATKEELQQALEELEIPSIDGLATQQFVIERIEEAKLEQGEVDLTDYATKVDLQAAIGSLVIPDETKLATKEELQAVEEQIPSLNGLATESYVQEQINGLNIPEVDLSQYPSRFEMEVQLGKKVDAEEGKGLIDLDEVERLAGVSNYDDSIIRELINTKSDEGHSHSFFDLADVPEIPSIGHLATKVELQAVEEKIPSVENLITREELEEVRQQIPSTLDLATKDELETVRSEIPTIDHLATKEELGTKSEVVHTHYVKDLLDLTLPSKVSDLENDMQLATETFVRNAIAEAELNAGEGEIDLTGYATKDDLFGKVDKEQGKGLSTNDFTTELRNMLLSNNNKVVELETAIQDKVDKVEGKGLSTNDFTDELKAMLESNKNRIDVIEKSYLKTISYQDNVISFKSGDDTDVFALEIVDEADIQVMLDLNK